jgi:outer membrane protein assembly factor BamB
MLIEGFRALVFRGAMALLAVSLVILLAVSCGRGKNSVVAGSKPALTTDGATTPRAGLEPAPATHVERSLDSILAEIDAYPVPKGVSVETWATLVTALKREIVARSENGKTVSVVPTGTWDEVKDLAAVSNPAGTTATLKWTEELAGDYNNDGAVSIADLAPLAFYYGTMIFGWPSSPAFLCDGDGNGELGVSDLQPLAADYGSHIQGYVVWRGHYNGATVDWETSSRPNQNPANPNWSVDRPVPPLNAKPIYYYSDDITAVSDKANVRYKVVAYGDRAAGVESNEAAMTVFQLADSPWPKFRGDPQNTGQSPYPGAQTNTVKWTYTTGGAVESSPAIAQDGTIYFGSGDDNVYALNPDGTLKWSFATGGFVSSSPAVGADGTVYVGSDDLNVYALNPTDGTVKWSSLVGGMVESSPAVGPDGTVYVGSDSYKVYALDPADGSIKWSYLAGNMLSMPAVAVDGTVYVSGGAVYALNGADGSVKWIQNKAGGDVTPVMGSDGTVYAGGGCALNPADGTIRRKYAGSPAAISADGTLYVCDGGVRAINPADGSVKWTHTTGGFITGSPAIGADGTIYVGSQSGSVYALNPTDGSEKWSYATGNPVLGSAAIAADGTVYIGSNNYKLYAFGP